MLRDQQSIQDIWNAVQEVLNFTADMDYTSLSSDRSISGYTSDTIANLLREIAPFDIVLRFAEEMRSPSPNHLNSFQQ